ncbi:MAG: hypothetical protein OXM55_08180 [Bdellovibrionales bacterium]|nr:hypothetical protein [Bdellovibrionales bacterium]
MTKPVSKKVGQMRFSFFLFIFILFLSCRSPLDFVGDEEEASPSRSSSGGQETSCLKKMVEGRELCVKEVKETFHIKGVENKPVYFLFILDVSSSMTDDLARFGQAFEDLMSQIHNSNWVMFFTTADHGDHISWSLPGNSSPDEDTFTQQKWEDYKGKEPHFGRLMDLEHKGKRLNQQQLDVNTPNYIEVFKDTLTRGSGDSCNLAPYCQGDMEQPLRVLNSCLERWAQAETLSKHPEADIISFIVTDEDERKEDQKQATTAREVMDNFEKLFPKRSLYSFSLVIQDEECLRLQKKHAAGSVYGTKVSELAEITHGDSISICEENYGPRLEKLSHILRSLIESVELKKEPVLVGETKVKFIDGTDEVKWELRGKKLVFKKALEPGSKIQVSYFVEVK